MSAYDPQWIRTIILQSYRAETQASSKGGPTARTQCIAVVIADRTLGLPGREGAQRA